MNEIEEIRNASPIEDIVGQHTELKKVGKSLKGLCTFHEETDASFLVYPETQSFHCYGCGEGGDVFSFVMRKEHLSFREALNKLAVQASLPEPSLDAEALRKAKEAREIENAKALAAYFYHQQLMGDTPIGDWSQRYLAGRGVTRESIEDLQLGVASGSGLLDFLRSRGVDDSVTKRAGLVTERNGQLREFMQGRIVFPLGRKGRVANLAGRGIGNKKPKYLGLSGPKAFSSSTVRLDQRNVILVEGPLDAIALYQLGYSAVPLMGTSLKDEWLPELAPLDLIYTCFDNDEAGQKAAQASASKIGERARNITLPIAIKDPAEFVEKGHTVTEFQELLEAAQDPIEYLINQISSDVDRIRLPDALEPAIDELAKLDKAKAEAYLQNRIAPRFSFKAAEMGAYRSTIAKKMKEYQQKKKQQDLKNEQTEETEKEPEEDYSPYIEEANRLLQDPALLLRVGETVEKLGLAGEGTNLLLTYLVITSRIQNYPISATVKGDSAVGKSYMVDRVLKLFPSQAFIRMTAMSRQALVYDTKSLSHKTIVMFESPGMEAADYNIRTLESEGVLIFETVEKNPFTGRFETRRIERQGPTNFIITTTNPSLHPENETRHWSVYMDESREQTLRAKNESAKRYMEPSQIAEEEIALWKCVQNQLQPLEVRIRFAKWLAERTPNQPVEMRRNFNRMLSLIEVIAIFYQKQRPIYEDRYIEANLADYFMAKVLGQQVFSASSGGISEKVKKLSQAVKEIYDEKAICDEADTPVKPRDLAAKLGVSPSSVSRWLKPAIEAGLVEVIDETRKGRIRGVKPGDGAIPADNSLPTLEEMADHFPDMAKDFKVIHPLTGEELTLEPEETTIPSVEKILREVVKQ